MLSLRLFASAKAVGNAKATRVFNLIHLILQTITLFKRAHKKLILLKSEIYCTNRSLRQAGWRRNDNNEARRRCRVK